MTLSTLSPESIARTSTAPIAFLPPDAFVGWCLHEAIDPVRCAALLDEVRARGFDRTGERYPASYRDNDRLVLDDPALAEALFEVLRDRLPPVLGADGLPRPRDTTDATESNRDDGDERWELCALNPRFRGCRYADGQSFCIHRDGPYAPSDDVRSFLTVQIYLDDDPDRVGGHTRFYADARGATAWASIAPKAGAAIVFDHRAWHDGEPVTAGIKHVLRTDAMYRRVRRFSARHHSARDPLASDGSLVGQHRGYAWQAIVLRDGSIASAGRDGTICRWTHDAPRGSTIDLHAGSVTCLVEDGHGRIWCGTRSGEIWCLGDRDVVRITTGLAAITSAARNGDLVAFTTSQGEVIAFRDVPDLTTRSTTPGTLPAAWTALAHDGWAWGIAAHGDGFVSCGHDGRVMRIDGHGRAREWAALGAPLRAIASHQANVVVGDDRGWLHWLARDGRVVRAVRAHAATVTAIAIDVVVPAGNAIAGDALVPAIDAIAIARDAAAIDAIAIAGDAVSLRDHSVVSTGEDGRVMRTHTRGGDVLLELDDFATSVAIASAGEVIVAGYDGCIRRVSTAIDVSDARADRAAS